MCEYNRALDNEKKKSIYTVTLDALFIHFAIKCFLLRMTINKIRLWKTGSIMLMLMCCIEQQPLIWKKCETDPNNKNSQTEKLNT
jgi:hypothetical protein